MEKGYLNEVKAILKSLVLSSTDKMTIDQLNRDYRDIEGEFIPYRRLGFVNMEQFLRSLTDTLRVFGTGPTAMVCFVANEKSDHIHDMIMEQKKPRRTRPRRTRSKGSSNSGRSSNKFSNNSQPRRSHGQQFSSFQTTNRSHMTNTATVRDIPASSVNKYPNHRPPCFTMPPLSTGYQLPQPAGINSKPTITQNGQKALTNLMQKTAAENLQMKEKLLKQQQEEVQKLSNLLTSSCRLTTTPTLASTSPTKLPLNTKTPAVTPISETPSLTSYRTVSFSPQINVTPQTKPSTNDSDNTNNLNGIKPPNGSHTIKAPKPKIKLSKDVERLLNMPTRCNLNPIQETSNTHVNEENLKNPPTKDIASNSKTSNEESKTFFDVSDDKVNDIDEAIPEFAANNLVYRLDFPEHTVPYGRKIPAYVLSDDVYIGAYLRIFIAEIHSPFKFWFHIQKDEHELDTLMYQIERFYKSLDANDLCIPIACLTPGQTCAACYHDLWHRAEIVAPPVNNKIKVSFVDYGTVSEVDVKMVKLLASSFANLPKQALRGCLSHIKPRLLHWSHEATNYFLDLVLELMLYAKITEIDRKNQILYMIICNTHGDEVVQINKSLVENNYALLNDDWLEQKIKKNNNQRLHHPREDFPTFSMIESGEYPSFAELVCLQERGIEYEDIHDHIIFNKSAILNKHENAPEAIRNLPYFLMTTNPFRSDIIMELNGIKNAAVI